MFWGLLVGFMLRGHGSRMISPRAGSGLWSLCRSVFGGGRVDCGGGIGGGGGKGVSGGGRGGSHFKGDEGGLAFYRS